MLFKFYIWGRLGSGDSDSAEVFVVATDLNHAWYKLVEYMKHSSTAKGFRLMTVKLMDISTSKGVILEWFRQDETD